LLRGRSEWWSFAPPSHFPEEDNVHLQELAPTYLLYMCASGRRGLIQDSYKAQRAVSASTRTTQHMPSLGTRGFQPYVPRKPSLPSHPKGAIRLVYAHDYWVEYLLSASRLGSSTESRLLDGRLVKLQGHAEIFNAVQTDRVGKEDQITAVQTGQESQQALFEVTDPASLPIELPRKSSSKIFGQQVSTSQIRIAIRAAARLRCGRLPVPSICLGSGIKQP